ncbi:hypothetical protein [Pseudarthrobacter sp. L1SW]|uniref:hypothetical protein n=1 Tax=Pseudarthrobacter sp. L1SW TaxID=2851598 RepID=UPI001E5F534D|nr:hypothetical protein [Pseudarthrobacter sp. L1SW]UEL29477.1 hypothetical protein KTR40_04970 [Pseudarthrobacter sp. L1SW]
MIQALLCKLNVRHEWHLEHAEDGGVYRRCRRCGKDDDQRSERGKGDFSTWIGLSGG